MNRITPRIATALLLFPLAAHADPAPADLQQQIADLQAKVRHLESSRHAPAYTARDIDQTIDTVIRDADRRSQLLVDSAGFLGGWQDDKFWIRSADGNYSLSPGVFFQFRSVTNINDKSDSQGGDNTDNGFEVRRLKLSLEGTAISKKLYYNFLWATDRKTGNLVNEEAYIRYALTDQWSIKAGSYKEFIYHETGMSSRLKLAVDVSLPAQVLFNGDVYTQGVEVAYEDQTLRASAGFSDGYGSVNTNFQDPPTNPFDFGVYGRVNYKVFGDWKSYSDHTALKNKKDLLVIGAGGDWSQAGDANTYRHAVDALWETGPFALFGAFVGKYQDPGVSDSRWDWAAVGQAAWLFNPRWELFGRYSYLSLDSNAVAAGNEDTFHELTVGVTYYFHNHNAKVTFDFSWLPSGAPSDLDGIGVLSNNGDNEFVIRGQFQLFI